MEEEKEPGYRLARIHFSILKDLITGHLLNVNYTSNLPEDVEIVEVLAEDRSKHSHHFYVKLASYEWLPTPEGCFYEVISITFTQLFNETAHSIRSSP